MAYCPECQQIVSIVMNTQGDYSEVRVKSERYVIHEGMDHHVGHDESYQPVVTTSSAPHCSNCFAMLEFPQATTRENLERKEKELIDSAKDKYINQIARSREILRTGDIEDSSFFKGRTEGMIGGIIMLLIISIIVGLFYVPAGIIVGLFFSCVIMYSEWDAIRSNESHKKYMLEQNSKSVRSIELRICKINNLGQYSHENYKKFKEIERAPIY